METKKLHKNKIKDVLDKISVLVNAYAKVYDLDAYIFNISHSNHDIHVPLLSVDMIDFKNYIKQSTDPDILKFVETLESLVSSTELEMLFIKKYYSDYMIIMNIIQMLIYNVPREALETDLIELNKLYKKYTKNDTNKTTQDTNK